ncbi:MAG TPA: HNH endonuclease, partial [Anaerovoracaceae bacterium]|nr:HNH endonuclease [Anaerovoracaceae bacterium]
KIEVISFWDDSREIKWGDKKIKHPAVVRLNHQVRWIPRRIRFNRTGVFRRDQFICQYCSATLTPSKLTLDHVLPRAQGGDSSWKNCVTSCFECNNRKGDRTPEQAKMKLIKPPAVPMLSIVNEFLAMRKQHEDWKIYIKT